MKVKLLRKLQRRLLKQAKTPTECRFNMKYFLTSTAVLQKVGEKSIIAKPVCGTQACLAGEALIMQGVAELRTELNGDTHYVFYGGEAQEAARILGMTPGQSRILFYFKDWNNNTAYRGTGWPKEFQIAYEAAKTGAERALIGAARLERFITSEGKE